jgi:hypothetical protein
VEKIKAQEIEKEKDKKPVQQAQTHNEIGKDAGWDDIPPTRETTETRCDGW